MGSISNYLENELLDHIFNNGDYTSPTAIWVGLSTADPLDDASGLAEPSGNGYSRKTVSFGAASSRRITQNADVTFDQATGSWGTITHWALFDAETGGNMLAHGQLESAKSVVSGNTPSIASGEIYVEVSAGECSDYLANQMLDYVFGSGSSLAQVSYCALTTATISDSDTGSTITEPSGNGYARVACDNVWNTASNGTLDNSSDIEFAQATGDWGTIVATALLDASTGGNLLLYDNDVTDQAVGNGDTWRFPAGDFDVSLD